MKNRTYRAQNSPGSLISVASYTESDKNRDETGTESSALDTNKCQFQMEAF